MSSSLTRSNGVAVGGDTDTRKGSGSIWQYDRRRRDLEKQVTLPQGPMLTPLRSVRSSESIDDSAGLEPHGRWRQEPDLLVHRRCWAWTFQNMGPPPSSCRIPPTCTAWTSGSRALHRLGWSLRDDAIGWVLGDDGANALDAACCAERPAGFPGPCLPRCPSSRPRLGRAWETQSPSSAAASNRGFPATRGRIGWVRGHRRRVRLHEALRVVTIEPPAAGVQATGTANIDASGGR